MDARNKVEKGIQIQSQRTMDDFGEMVVGDRHGGVNIKVAGTCQEVGGHNGLGGDDKQGDPSLQTVGQVIHGK